MKVERAREVKQVGGGVGEDKQTDRRRPAECDRSSKRQ